MTRYLLFAALALNLGACVSKTVGEFKPPEKLTGDTVTVLTFNVENLFDLEDDPDKNDEAFLPPNLKANAGFENRCRAQNSGRYMYECLEKTWTRNLLDRKMKRLTDVLAQVGDGRGPDILILQEIENEKVLREWRDKHLAKMNYQTLVLLEGPDERGIDTAILSRFPQIDTAKLHFIDFKKDEAVVKVAADSGREIRDSRSILEARLRLPNDQRLAVFAVHFPSQGANTAFRKYAMQTLLDVTAAVPAGTEVIVGGDFNITSREDWDKKYFKTMAAPRFTVSHMVGCHECTGTTYFPPDGTWSFFDVLLFSKGLSEGSSGYQLDKGSIRTVNSSVYQMNRFGTPARFGNGNGATGVSDHWPMYAELKLMPLQKVGAK